MKDEVGVNPILRGGGGIYAPPYHISAIFYGRTYPMMLQVYSKFKFCNCRMPKIGGWEAAKVGWVVPFFAPFLPKNWL